MSTTTLDDVRPVVVVRVINAIGDLLERRGIQISRLSTAKLMADAARRTRLSDWGPDAEAFGAEFELMVRSYREDADLTLLGRVAIRQILTRWLANRLLMQRDWTRHPEILEQPVPRPLFVTGLPRSGTTLLHRLLSQDPEARVPLLWELLWPSPPPTADTRETDPRIEAARDLLRGFHRINPRMAAIHSPGPQEPEECLWLMEELFAYIHANVVSYRDWLLKQDWTPYYRRHRKALQLLQWHCPGDHWILKTPRHTFAMDSILTVFPDACLVQTHRDPAKVIASVCSLIAVAHRTVSRRVDLQEIGKTAVTMWTEAVTRAMTVRAQADPAHFYDVHYDDLLADPVGVTRRVYEYFRYRFTSRHEARARQWLVENPQDKHGAHRYSLEQFGLDRESVRRHFAEYIEQFELGAEHRPRGGARPTGSASP